MTDCPDGGFAECNPPADKKFTGPGAEAPVLPHRALFVLGNFFRQPCNTKSFANFAVKKRLNRKVR